MGLFDYITGNTASDIARQRDQRLFDRQDLMGQRYNNLLGSYGQNDSFVGPIQQDRMPGLLSGGQPPPAFYLQAGGIPGYEQMAMQAQTGQQAMQRQDRQNNWTLGNEPLQATLDRGANNAFRGAELAQGIVRQNDQRSYQGGMLGNAQARLAWDKDPNNPQNAGQNGMPKLNTGQMYIQTPNGPMASPIPGTPEWSKITGEVQQIGQLNQALSYYDRMIDQHGTEAGQSPGAVALRDARGAVITLSAKLADAGVIDKEEFKRFEGRLPDPTDYTAWRGKDYYKDSTQGLREQLYQQYSGRQKQYGHVPGIDWRYSGWTPPPAGFKQVK